MTSWPQPPPAPEHLAQVLRLTKRQLVDLNPAEDAMAQPGGAILAERFELPDLSAAFADLTEPLIETFVVDANGACVPTGSDARLIDALAEPAAALAELARSALDRLDVALGWPAYLTASITPLVEVPNEPHFDDDQFVPDDGVGVVITAADPAGTRLAAAPLSLQPSRRGVPWAVDPLAEDDFRAGRIALQQAKADQVMAMVRFGQLHAGPVFDSGVERPSGVRVLLVFRADTVPPPS